MAERNEMLLANMIAVRAEKKPDLDVLTFEHLSLDAGATADEVRTYADLQTNANTLAAALIQRGMERGDRFALMLRDHPRDRSSFSPENLCASCRDGLESNFVPSYLQVVDEIPKTASEKPQERFLLADFAPDAVNVFTK